LEHRVQVPVDGLLVVADIDYLQDRIHYMCRAAKVAAATVGYMIQQEQDWVTILLVVEAHMLGQEET
jgi:nitrous oxide reductase